MSRSRTIAFVAAVRHRVELRRRRKHPQLGLAVLLGATVGVLVIVGSLPLPLYASFWPEPGAYHYGTVAADDAAVAALTREIGAIGVVVVAVLASLGATTSEDWEEAPVELVTALSLPTAIAGVLVDELLENAWFVGPTAIAGAVAFAAGTGTPVTVVGALAGGITVVLTGLLAGTAAGLGVRAAIRRSPRLYAARYVTGIVLVFATFLGLALSRSAGGALAATPLGWYGDLILVTTPGSGADPVRALAVLAGSGGVAVLAIGVVLAAARSLWFAEAVLDDGTVDSGSNPGFAGALTTGLETVSSRQTAAVVRAIWRRIARSPRAMIYVVLPFALVGPVTAEVSSSQPTLVPLLITLYAAAAVGLGTTLNPIGNERIALPVLLTTPGGRRAVLRGHALAALVPGIPLTIAVALATGIGWGYAGVSLAALAVVGVSLTVAAVGVSLGVGSFLPTLEGPMAASLTPPELSAMVAYLVAMAGLAAPAFAGFWPGWGDLALAPVAGAGATALGAALAGAGGYRYARGALERYEAGGEESTNRESAG